MMNTTPFFQLKDLVNHGEIYVYKRKLMHWMNFHFLYWTGRHSPLHKFYSVTEQQKRENKIKKMISYKNYYLERITILMLRQRSCPPPLKTFITDWLLLKIIFSRIIRMNLIGKKLNYSKQSC